MVAARKGKLEGVGSFFPFPIGGKNFRPGPRFAIGPREPLEKVGQEITEARKAEEGILERLKKDSEERKMFKEDLRQKIVDAEQESVERVDRGIRRIENELGWRTEEARHKIPELGKQMQEDLKENLSKGVSLGDILRLSNHNELAEVVEKKNVVYPFPHLNPLANREHMKMVLSWLKEEHPDRKVRKLAGKVGKLYGI